MLAPRRLRIVHHRPGVASSELAGAAGAAGPRPGSDLLGTFAVAGVLVVLITWGFGRVGQWLVSNSGRLQESLVARTEWLEGDGVSKSPDWSASTSTSDGW